MTGNRVFCTDSFAPPHHHIAMQYKCTTWLSNIVRRNIAYFSGIAPSCNGYFRHNQLSIMAVRSFQIWMKLPKMGVVLRSFRRRHDQSHSKALVERHNSEQSTPRNVCRRISLLYYSVSLWDVFDHRLL